MIKLPRRHVLATVFLLTLAGMVVAIYQLVPFGSVRGRPDRTSHFLLTSHQEQQQLQLAVKYQDGTFEYPQVKLPPPDAPHDSVVLDETTAD